MTICSHERYGTIFLSEEEYKLFKEYQIPHLIKADRWWLEEQRDSLEIVHVIIEERAILGGLLGPSYVVSSCWEDRLKIFRQYQCLPPIQYASPEKILIKLSKKYKMNRFYSDEIENQIIMIKRRFQSRGV